VNAIKDGMQQVLITVDESDETIHEFITYLSSNEPDFADVTSIHREVYDGEVVPIGTYLQDLLFEQFCKGIQAILRIEETQREILHKQDPNTRQTGSDASSSGGYCIRNPGNEERI
jgi:hypothetical protein